MLDRDETHTLEEQARRGDAAAFGELIRDLDRDLRGVVWAVVQSSHATDDVIQASYEKAFRGIGSFDGRSTLKTWLFSICYRSAIDHARYEARRRHADIDAVASSGTFAQLTAAPAGVERVDDQMVVDELFADLGAEQRALLMMTVGMGYSFDEIAQIVGMKRGTVASKVSRARAKLAERADR